jgi:hypothetical protein
MSCGVMACDACRLMSSPIRLAPLIASDAAGSPSVVHVPALAIFHPASRLRIANSFRKHASAIGDRKRFAVHTNRIIGMFHLLSSGGMNLQAEDRRLHIYSLFAILRLPAS